MNANNVKFKIARCASRRASAKHAIAGTSISLDHAIRIGYELISLRRRVMIIKLI